MCVHAQECTWGWNGGRGRGTIRLLAEHRELCGAPSHHPEFVTQAEVESGKLNQLSYPGAQQSFYS